MREGVSSTCVRCSYSDILHERLLTILSIKESVDYKCLEENKRQANTGSPFYLCKLSGILLFLPILLFLLLYELE